MVKKLLNKYMNKLKAKVYAVHRGRTRMRQKIVKQVKPEKVRDAFWRRPSQVDSADPQTKAPFKQLQ